MSMYTPNYVFYNEQFIKRGAKNRFGGKIASELKIKTSKDVYEPAEDSWLLAKYAATAKGSVLEIGCGTGIVALTCAKAYTKSKVEGVDINTEAVQLSIANAKMNNITNAKFYESDLFSAVKGKYDCILFNAPYLPTGESEKVKGKLNAALDGGATGRDVVDQFIKEAKDHLKPKGTILLLISSLTEPEKVLSSFKENGFKADVLEEQSFFFEKLVLIRATK